MKNLFDVKLYDGLLRLAHIPPRNDGIPYNHLIDSTKN